MARGRGNKSALVLQKVWHYGYLITPYDPAIEAELEAGRQFMKEYRETFKALAK